MKVCAISSCGLSQHLQARICVVIGVACADGICASLSAQPQMFAEEITPAQIKTGIFRSSLEHKLPHGGGDQQPHLTHRPALRFQYSYWANPILQESPTSIDDLRP